MRISRILSVLAVASVLSVSCRTNVDTLAVPECDPAFIHVGASSPYHPGDVSDTPAPKGYEPFYVSHYGRHGSRYQRTSDHLAMMIAELGGEMDRGNLTPVGEALLDSLVSKSAFIDGKFAQLTPRGCIEHRSIASRMAVRFPQVFRKNSVIDAMASVEGGRCIVSMCCFTNELQKRIPSLRMNFRGGYDIYALLSSKNYSPEVLEYTLRQAAAQWYLSEEETSAALSRIFVNPGNVCFDCLDLLDGVFDEWKYSGCMDRNFIDLKSVFPSCEEKKYVDREWDIFLSDNGNSLTWGRRRIAAQIPSLHHIVDNADDVIAGRSEKSADLRFGHDSGLAALLSLMRMSPFDVIQDFSQPHESWNDDDRMPMASNLQLVFYRRKGSDRILVKALFNEQERSFPFVESVCGPYYDWETLRNSWLEYAAFCEAAD